MDEGAKLKDNCILHGEIKETMLEVRVQYFTQRSKALISVNYDKSHIYTQYLYN